MRKSQLVALLLIFTPIALTACGQKGALYLPADTSTQALEIDAAALEEEAKKEASQGSE